MKIWSPGKSLKAMERQIIIEALQHFHFNRTQAALALRISLRTLRNRLAQWRMEDGFDVIERMENKKNAAH